MGHALHSQAAASALAAREELVEAVDFFIQWKDALIQVHPLPIDALLPLLTTSSQLIRCRDVLKNNIRTLANLAQSFARGLLSNEHLNRLKTTAESVKLELSMEKKRRIEATRKLNTSLGLLRRYHDELKYVRWYRLTLKLQERMKSSASEEKVKAAQTSLNSLRQSVSIWKKKSSELEALQKATSQVAVKNQTRADVLERQMRKSTKREKQLTENLSAITNDHAFLQRAMKELEEETKGLTKGLKDSKDDQKKKKEGVMVTVSGVVGSVEGEWIETRKEHVTMDIAREKENRVEREKKEKEEKEEREENQRKEEKRRQMSAATPLWQPSSELSKKDLITSPVARAAKASSERRKKNDEEDEKNEKEEKEEEEKEEEMDPWSAEATTPPPVYVEKKNELQDNFTTRMTAVSVAGSTSVAGGSFVATPPLSPSMPAVSSTLEEGDIRTKAGSAINMTTINNDFHEGEREEGGEEKGEKGGEEQKEKRQDREAISKTTEKKKITASPPTLLSSIAPLPLPTSLSTTTTVSSSSTVTVSIEVVSAMRQQYADEMMKVQQRHESHIHASGKRRSTPWSRC